MKIDRSFTDSMRQVLWCREVMSIETEVVSRGESNRIIIDLE